MANLLLLFLFFLQVSVLAAAETSFSDPEPASIQIIPSTTAAAASSPPATIPAFPEQSDVSATGCPLDPPADLLPLVSASCSASDEDGGPSRSRCCPVLEAWFLAAYSASALAARAPLPAAAAAGLDMPALPDDSESCIGGVERALRDRGVDLPRANDTCDAAYCFCGIRLRRMACPGAFVADAEAGRLVPAGSAARRLEKDCARPGFAACNRCLRSLNQLKAKSKRSGRSNSPIIIDTYGGWGAHGGGAFSGKDPTKVDRSGAYIARQAAKSIVANGLARRCIVQVSYAIGVPEPLSVFVDTYGTGKIPDKEILQIVKENFDFRPGMITINLDLKKGGHRFLKTAAYGHFGRDDPDFTWEVVKPLKWDKPFA